MKKKPKTKGVQQKQKQTVNIKINLGKSAKRKSAPRQAQPKQAPAQLPTMMSNVYHQYFNPVAQPPRSIVAQTINPLADNVLPSVALASQITEGKVKTDLLTEKDITDRFSGMRLPEHKDVSPTRTPMRTRPTPEDIIKARKKDMKDFYIAGHKSAEDKMAVLRNKPPPSFDDVFP